MTTKQVWYVRYGAIIMTIIATITLATTIGWVMPWNAAPQKQVDRIERKVERTEKKVDLLLHKFGIEVPYGRDYPRRP